MIRLAVAALLIAPGPTLALSLQLPAGAEMTAETTEAGDALLAAGPAEDGAVPRAEYAGRVSRQAWRVPGAHSTYELAEALQLQLEEDGYDILASCDTRLCGGFDFRFQVEVIPEPSMHVDLGDFRYLLAQREGGEGTEAVSLLVSRSAEAGFVQIVSVEPGAGAPEAEDGVAVEVAPPDPVSAFDPASLVAVLEREGHVVLDDLAFETGSATLGEGSYESLRELGGYLRENPDRTVAVVGHTDAVGGLDGNILLSRRRAASVVERLVGKYGAAPRQVQSEGVGYLAPRASNLTAEGREMNRRVEVVLTSTE